MSKEQLTCDVLVVGSGPGGAVTAMVLAQAGCHVIIVEEGTDDAQDVAPYSMEEMNLLYRNGGLSVSLGKPKVSYLEACCLGGASEINGGLYHRPIPHVIDQWQKEYDISEFSFKELEPFLEMNEKELGVGTGPSSSGVGANIIERGARSLNWDFTRVPRLWDQSSVKSMGQRRSMSHSFLPKAKNAGAKIIARTKVLKINFDKDKAIEALCVSSGEQKNFFSIKFKSIFVCAGAVQTPFLLRQSGLEKNIGDRLKFHLSIRLIARFNGPASDPQEGVPVCQVSEFKPKMTIGGSFGSPAYLALWLAGREDFAELMKFSSHLGIFHAYFSADSYGRVRPGPMGTGAIVLMDIKDEDYIFGGDAFFKMGKILFAAGAQMIYSPVLGASDFRTLEDLDKIRDLKLVRKVDLSTMHLFASCPMGEDQDRCAVDSFGRVHGTRNIYVNDSSMLSDSPGSNPQALIMALARRNAMHWLINDRD